MEKILEISEFTQLYHDVGERVVSLTRAPRVFAWVPLLAASFMETNSVLLLPYLPTAHALEA